MGWDFFFVMLLCPFFPFSHFFKVKHGRKLGDFPTPKVLMTSSLNTPYLREGADFWARNMSFANLVET